MMNGSLLLNQLRSRGALLEFYNLHREAIDWAVAAVPKGNARIAISGVWSVLARAYYHIDETRLRWMAEILKNGFPPGGTLKPGDKSIIMVRNYLLNAPSGGGNAGVRTVYLRVSKMIFEAWKGRDYGRVVAADQELFPLPEESE
jgi:hypothetical protein